MHRARVLRHWAGVNHCAQSDFAWDVTNLHAFPEFSKQELKKLRLIGHPECTWWLPTHIENKKTYYRWCKAGSTSRESMHAEDGVLEVSLCAETDNGKTIVYVWKTTLEGISIGEKITLQE